LFDCSFCARDHKGLFIFHSPSFDFFSISAERKFFAQLHPIGHLEPQVAAPSWRPTRGGKTFAETEAWGWPKVATGSPKLATGRRQSKKQAQIRFPLQ